MKGLSNGVFGYWIGWKLKALEIEFDWESGSFHWKGGAFAANFSIFAAIFTALTTVWLLAEWNVGGKSEIVFTAMADGAEDENWRVRFLQIGPLSDAYRHGTSPPAHYVHNWIENAKWKFLWAAQIHAAMQFVAQRWGIFEIWPIGAKMVWAANKIL